jgi:hypothetical protein
MASSSSNKWVRKGIGALLILATLPVPITGNDLGLTVAIGLTTVGLILLFFG